MEELRKMIEEKTGMPVEISEVIKNSKKKQAFVIGSGDARLIVYAEDVNVDNIDDVLKEAEKKMNDGAKIREDVMDVVKDWDTCKDKLIVCVGPHVDDTDDVRRQVLDIDEYVRVEFDFGSCRVVNSMLEKWGKTAEEIFDQAKQNMEYKIKSMKEMMKELMGAQGMPEEMIDEMFVDDEESPMYVVTSKTGYFGASAMLDKDVLDKLAEKLGQEKIYIIPSSVHEIIVIGRNEANDGTGIGSIIGTVNEECLAEADVLSNTLYSYTVGDDSLKIA